MLAINKKDIAYQKNSILHTAAMLHTVDDQCVSAQYAYDSSSEDPATLELR